jgi:hypothetical protein
MTHVVPKFDGDNFFLSNFYVAPTVFMMNGERVTMPTGEHAFQAAKCHALVDKSQKTEYVLGVAEAPTPSKAKYLGRSARIHLDVWEDVRVKCMREIVWQKFIQHPDLRTRLLNTHDAMLVEGNDWNDTFWGRCNGKGYNKLGVLLMEVRGYWLWQSKLNSPEMGS